MSDAFLYIMDNLTSGLDIRSDRMSNAFRYMTDNLTNGLDNVRD
jgi:ABC-type multidrug transport system ATPase subunit